MAQTHFTFMSVSVQNGDRLTGSTLHHDETFKKSKTRDLRIERTSRIYVGHVYMDTELLVTVVTSRNYTTKFFYKKDHRFFVPI